MDKFASVYRRLPYHWKYGLFAARFASAIERSSGLKLFPRLQHYVHRHPLLIGFIKDGNRLVIRFDITNLFQNRRYFDPFWKRVPVMTNFFTRSNPEICRALADLSDGDLVGDGTLSFCSGLPGACLIPDVNFLRSGGYVKYRRIAASHPGNWSERSDLLVWRGAASDAGDFPETMNDNKPGLKPRVRMCIALRDVPDVDAKIYRVPYAGREARQFLQRNGLIGEFIPQNSWINRKFAIDIDGVSNAWGNLFVRLILGCCVIKVESPRGFRQWYYDDLVPFEHYVPVKSDMSDLLEKIDWCRSHDEECRAIGEAAQSFALKRTVATETALSVRRLNDKLADFPRTNGQRPET